MTPAVVIVPMSRDEAMRLTVRYSFAATPFGDIVIASTPQGICSVEFADTHADAVAQLGKRFPGARVIPGDDISHATIAAYLANGTTPDTDIVLHLRGTAFQLAVWAALLDTPAGSTTTYSRLAAAVGNRGACRAVGNAVGANPVAILIPCHRVVRADGSLGNYRWGAQRKKEILSREMDIEYTP